MINYAFLSFMIGQPTAGETGCETQNLMFLELFLRNNFMNFEGSNFLVLMKSVERLTRFSVCRWFGCSCI